MARKPAEVFFMTRCSNPKCGKEIHVTFPYGTKSKPFEIGHIKGCKNKVFSK